MKRFLIWTALILVSGFVLVKGYLYYQVTNLLDELVTLASPFTRITYTDVSTTMQGEVRVEGISLQVYSLDMPISIDQVSVTFPDLKTMLFIKSDLRQRELPEHMQFSVEHLQFDLDMLKPWVEQISKDMEMLEVSNGAYGCSALEQVDPIMAMQLLGYSKADLGFNFGYQWDAEAQRLNYDSDFSWHDMTSSSLSMKLEDVSPTLVGTSALPKIQSIKLTVEDAGYNPRMINYCAEQENISAEDFIARHMKLAREASKNQGLTLDEPLYEAYEYYVRTKGPLLISMYPDDISNLANMHLYKPADIPALLGLEIRFGDRVIREIKWDWDEQKVAKAVETYQQRRDPPPRKSFEPSPKEKNEEKVTYRQVSKDQLSDFLGREVIIDMADGRTFKGTLKGAREDRISIEVVMGAGNATLPLDFQKITAVEVRE